jgi:uncharacterized UPF0160 family protein
VHCSALLLGTAGPVPYVAGAIMLFGSGGVPWKEHLYAIEKKNKLDDVVKFVLYQDDSGMWRIQVSPAPAWIGNGRM